MTLGDGAARHSNSCCAPCCSGGGTASIVGIHRSAARSLFLHIFRRTRDGVMCTVVVQGIDQPALAVFLVSRRPGLLDHSIVKIAPSAPGIDTLLPEARASRIFCHELLVIKTE